MQRMGRYMKLLVALGAVTLLGAFAWACTSSDTDDLEAQIDELTTQVQSVQETQQQTQMMAALYILNNAGLHGIDEAANAGEELPEGASGGVDRALLAVALTAWPEDLQAGADTVQTALEDLATALDGTDNAAIAAAATAAHDGQHEFADEAGAMLNEAAGLAVEEHEDSGETAATPSPTP
ncbi:MAG: hypothetical protein WEE64_11010 [Dehalococcoidia bacterium]